MRALKEIRSWGRSLLGVARWQPGVLVVVVAAVWLARPSVPLLAALACGVVATAVGLRCWALTRPVSFGRATALPRTWWWRRQVREVWPDVAAARGLDVHGLPELRSIAGLWPHLRVTVRPVRGQMVEDYEAAGPALQTALGVARVRCEPRGFRDIVLHLTVGDELRRPFPATARADVLDLSFLPLGRTERGETWRLSLGPHTLVAGSSGAGKGSVFWSLAFALAGAVHDGRVLLHGIDLKGGMEILMGRELFSTTATDAGTAVASLEHLVTLMRERNLTYAGKVRSHRPSTDEPLHVVMIDELAALTAYSTERDLQRRAEAAINLLCSQGRATGFVLIACLQDPRKEVIPSRGLFTQTVGLRLKDASETAMVLGDSAATTGAACHRITRDVPGTAYVVPEDGGPALRVRAGYASDDAIREVAQRFATPVLVDVPPLVSDDLGRRPRRPSRESSTNQEAS
ncbi:FtsK/SpoIIIE domain-containing protein [Nocardioides sp. GY 10127]|uniref:FtsK/SpoIIIE domain-containing protein n=1 Tax=Nocardioides sp. GY 10127 TaxID=2569762 RepID=UPI001458077C|nr:FtsK/SpoIIIE domain-containing protein [Nocardioides sp. GY 10127]